MLDYKNPQRVKPGKLYSGEMPSSEVCMCMRVAGKVLQFELLQDTVQLYLDGRPFSTPILTGEAGLYSDDKGYYYYPPVKELV